MSSSIVYSAHGIHYSKVCCQINAYKFGVPNGFPPLHGSYGSLNIENCNTYVDSVTITYGSNPRKHIWTYACGAREGNIVTQYKCPCNVNNTRTTAPIAL